MLTCFWRSQETNTSEAFHIQCTMTLVFDKIRFSSITSNVFASKFKKVFFPIPGYVKRGELGGRGGQQTNDTAGEKNWNGESDINFRAMTKWSCALNLLDSCPTPFPLWVAVWRLTAGLSKRPPPYSPCFQRPFPLNHFILHNNSERQYYHIRHCDWEH